MKLVFLVLRRLFFSSQSNFLFKTTNIVSIISLAKLIIETILVVLNRKLLCDEKKSLLKTRKTSFILKI